MASAGGDFQASLVLFIFVDASTTEVDCGFLMCAFWPLIIYPLCGGDTSVRINGAICSDDFAPPRRGPSVDFFLPSNGGTELELNWLRGDGGDGRDSQHCGLLENL